MLEVSRDRYLLYDRIVRTAMILFPDKSIKQIETQVLGIPFRQIRQMSKEELQQILKYLESLK